MKAKLANFIALDIGSSKITSIAAYIDKKGDSRILSQNLHFSEGIKSGLITNFKAAENSIINAIYALEKACDKNIKHIAISLPGAGTKSYYINHKLKLANQQITKQDVKKLIQKALEKFTVQNQEIIHYFPLEFNVDNNNAITDPVGMVGKEIGCQLHIIAVNADIMVNLTNCLAKYQVEITNAVLAIFASGLSCLTEDEKEVGAIIIDLGANTTAFGVFYQKKLIYTGHISIGGAHITADIAKLFSISLNSAERLKVLYGNAIAAKFDKDYHINIAEYEDVDSSDIYQANMTITSNHLNAIIQARFAEILLLVKQQYDKVGIDHLIAKRLVLTGGGAGLKGARELAYKIFDKQVRIAKPIVYSGFTEDYNPFLYSPIVGMIKNHAAKQQKSFFENDSAGLNNSWAGKVIGWLKENI